MGSGVTRTGYKNAKLAIKFCSQFGGVLMGKKPEFWGFSGVFREKALSGHKVTGFQEMAGGGFLIILEISSRGSRLCRKR